MKNLVLFVLGLLSPIFLVGDWGLSSSQGFSSSGLFKMDPLGFQFQKPSQSQIQLQARPQRLRLGTYNLLNAWDGNPKNSLPDQLKGYEAFQPEFSNWYDPQVQEAKATSIALALRAMSLPDLVGVQELESAYNQSEIFNLGTPLRRQLEALGYSVFLVGPQSPHSPVSITTGFISKLPLQERPSISLSEAPEFSSFTLKEKDFIRSSLRAIQVVDLRWEGHRIRIFNNHWKSQGCNDSFSCRLGERAREVSAQILRRGIQESLSQDPELQIIALGDFNASYDSLSYQSLIREDTLWGLPLVISPWWELSPQRRGEYSFGGKYVTLSNVFMSPSLLSANSLLRYRRASFHVVGTSTARSLEGEDPQEAWYLINADGAPLQKQKLVLRWDQLETQLQSSMRSVLLSRGCRYQSEGRGRWVDPKEPQSRKCSSEYTYYSGSGFSDHLPLVWELESWGGTTPALSGEASLLSQGPSPGDLPFWARDQIQKLRLESPPLPVPFMGCRESAAEIFLGPRDLDFTTHGQGSWSFFKKCFEGHWESNPLPLVTEGKYDGGYVLLQGQKLGITMARRYDEGSRDQCWARRVLQGSGGEVVRVKGRIGWDQGKWTVMVWDLGDIELRNLPSFKKGICSPK